MALHIGFRSTMLGAGWTRTTGGRTVIHLGALKPTKLMGLMSLIFHWLGTICLSSGTCSIRNMFLDVQANGSWIRVQR